MRETALVTRIRQWTEAKGPGSRRLVKGIGDDCAILRPVPGEDLVFTADLVLEGRHFDLATHTPADIGHKALARSLSDLAAMGSSPVFCLVSLALPKRLGPRWLNGFYRGLLTLADAAGISLAGGDLASFSHVIADVTCAGSVPKGKAMLRSAAKPGDIVYVTGTLGASAHAFRLGKESRHWKRHLRPRPRLAAGQALRKLGVSACIDLSDGLSLDLHRLCAESEVGAELTGHLPVARDASLEDALHGGEDYELLFTAPPSLRIPANPGKTCATRIGIITKGHPGRVRFAGRKLESGGFDHFS